MTRDLDPDDSPGLALAAFVVVVCVVGAALIVAGATLWGMFA